MMKAKLQEYALIAEIIGAASIVASLLFVGFQIQQNSEAQLAGSRQNLLEADLSVLDNLIDHPNLYNPANADSLEGDEINRRDAYWVSILRIREFAWQQYKNDFLDEESLKSYLEPLRFIFDSEAGREFLLTGEFRGDPEFDEYVIDYLQLEN